MYLTPFKCKYQIVSYFKVQAMANVGIFEEAALENPEFNGENYTNRVLVQETVYKNTYYCPAYMRIKVKNFAEMSLTDLQAKVNSTIIYTVNFRGVPMILEKEIMSRMVLRFNRDEALVLDEQNTEVNIKSESGLHTYTVRKLINTGITPEIFYSPFEILNLIMSITSQSIELSSKTISKAVAAGKKKLEQLKEKKQQKVKDNNSTKQKQEKKKKQIEDLKIERPESKEFKTLEKEAKEMESHRKLLIKEISDIDNQIQAIQDCFKTLKDKTSVLIKFNLMDYPVPTNKKDKNYVEQQSIRRNMKISFTEEGTFGNYDLAERLMKAEYSNENLPRITETKKNKQVDDYSKITEFKNSHFIIPLYKFPVVSILTIFLPLWLLGIINLGIFFQQTGLADRIGSLAGLMIAFVALIPVIRSELPPNPTVTLVQVLVYCQTSTTLFCFIESMRVRNQAQNNIIWYQNGLFLVSFLIEILEMLIMAGLYIRYKWYDLPRYNEASPDVKQEAFKYEKWQNVDCDKHFQRKIDAKEIKVAPVPKMYKKSKKNA